MANPIKKDELVTSEALEQLNQMATTLTTIADNLTKAKTACQGWVAEEGKSAAATGDNVETLTKMLNKITDIENAIKALNKAEKENNETRRTVNAERRKYAKLTEEEAERVRHLSEAVEKYIKYTNSQVQSLRGLAEIYGKTVVEIDMQKKSYNELYQTYNVIKDALNKMTLEERLNTEAGKMMTAQALKIRDSLNELQKSTGNYSLQVGKYSAAFDGLGFSFQQILREAPSALNIQQFMLAISNNIPLFMDQLDRYKVKQQEIKAELEKMRVAGQAGTKDFELLSKQVEGWGKHLLRSFLSWQTVIIAVTFLLRKLPDIIKGIKTWWDKWKNGIREAKNEVDGLTASIRLQADAIKKYASTSAQLDLIIMKMGEIEQGTEKWATGVRMINNLTGQTKAKEDDNLKTLKEITDEYKKQARQIAINNVLGEMYEQNLRNELLRDRAYNIYGTYAGQENGIDKMTAAGLQMLGLSPDSKEAKELKGLYQDQANAIRDLNKARQKQYDDLRKRQGHWGTDAAGNPAYIRELETDEDVSKRVRKAVDDANMAVTNFYNRYTEMYEKEDFENLAKKMFDLVDPLKEPKGSSGGKTYTEKDVLDRTWEVMEARARMIQDEQKREEALQEAANQKAIQQNDKTWKTQQEHLAFNLEHQFITTEEYNAKIKQVKEEHDLIEQGLEEENQKKLMDIWHKYDQKRQEAIRKSEKDQIDAILKYGELQQKAVRRRVKSIGDEKEKNAELLRNVREYEATIQRLESLPLSDPESIDKRADEVDKLTQKIGKLKKELRFDKQLSNYSSFWDILQRNGAFDTDPSTMQSIARNLLGDIADSLDPEQIEQIFDQWLENAGKAISQWYSTTMGYINDLINAYIELANAKAEAAREATEAAQEEYEKEKALLEAGYASRMETMWGEYMEKKKLQEQAEADAKKAEQAQRMLNELQTVSSLITASANMYKIMSALGPIGIPLATLAVGSMFAAFVAAKAKAAEAAKYGDGDVQVVGGGSHASGHDTLLGYSLQGREMRVENGEVVGIIPRRSVRRIGEQNVLSTMRALRDGTFEANAVKMMGIERNAGMVTTMMMPRTDLRRLERGVDSLVSYGKNNTYVDAHGNIIERSDYGTTKYIRR